jgi:hypothetical protein
MYIIEIGINGLPTPPREPEESDQVIFNVAYPRHCLISQIYYLFLFLTYLLPSGIILVLFTDV